MRRLLSLLLVLTVAATAFAAPAYACVPTKAGISTARHDCCDGPVLTPTPVGTCCVVSAPIQRTGSTESRNIVPNQMVVTLPRAMSGGLRQPDVGRDIPPPVLLASSVPVYLQQLSLLI